MGEPALFLDRDGVINVDHGYVHRREDFEFLPGIFELCRAALRLGHRLFVITNQAGIARGYFTERDFHALTQWMCAQFADQGVPISGVYFCPTHPAAGIGAYRVESEFRKPGPGMILQAAAEHGIDLAASTLIGDKLSDLEAGLAAGVARNVLLVQGGVPGSSLNAPAGCWAVASLAEAEQILHHDKTCPSP